MKSGNTYPVLILLSLAVCGIVLYFLLGERSSNEAQLSFRSLIPLFPFTRHSTIKHVDFNPVTLQQKANNRFQFKERLEQLVKTGTTSKSDEIISIIRNNIIQQPSVGKVYNLVNKDLFDYSGGQSAIVDNNLKFKEDGFYIECCNSDGEKDSSTLFFERVRKWNGMVISTDPQKFIALRQKNRKAMTMNSCISDTHEIQKKTVSVNNQQEDIYCFPLNLILAAMERKKIDFFALDVGGEEEMSILKSLPLDKLDIDMIAVRFKGEIRHFKSDVQLYLEEIGYNTVLKLIKESDDSVHHLIMKKKVAGYTLKLRKTFLFVALILTLGAIICWYVPKHYQKGQKAFPAS